jgi:hypothetical protein
MAAYVVVGQEEATVRSMLPAAVRLVCHLHAVKAHRSLVLSSHSTPVTFLPYGSPWIARSVSDARGEGNSRMSTKNSCGGGGVGAMEKSEISLDNSQIMHRADLS